MLFLAVPLFVVARMFWLAWTQGRDPVRDSASVQYEPPDKLTPGECGALLENTAGVHLITATIVDLSVRGYLAIEQKDDSSLETPEGYKNYLFHMLKTIGEWKKLKAHEVAVLTGIFVPTNPLRMLTEAVAQLQPAAAGNPLMAESFSRIQAMTEGDPMLHAIVEAKDEAQPTVALLELQNHFYLHLERIRASIFNTLVASGFYAHRPDQTQLLYAAKGVLAGFVMAIAGGMLAAKTGMVPWPWILIGALTGAFIWVSGKLLSPRTAAGARTFAKVLGFKEYLQRVEKGQIEQLDKTPELFEKYLPYAMALQVESKWSQAFGAVAVPAPQWYQRQRSSDFFPMHLTEDLAGMSTQAGSVLTSKPGSA